ncbi:WD repeat-containing protein 76, partial [Tanacetum coccineum]
FLRKLDVNDIRTLYAAHNSIHGLPGMLDSIDCMHWEWINCLKAWHGQFGRGKLFAVLNHSPLFNDMLDDIAPIVPYEVNRATFEKGYYLADEMETQRLTEYERRRLENIKRNDEMLASFKIKSKLADLTAFTKLHREETNISRKVKPKTPAINRRSLRTQGNVPDSTGLKYKIRKRRPEKQLKTLKSQFKELEPVSMKDANTCFKSDQILISQLKNGDVHGRVKASIDLDSMKLAPKNVANVLKGMIRSIKFFPSTDMRMVVVGNKVGTIGFWNVDSENEDGDGIYKYHTNPGLVSAILIQPFSMNKSPVHSACFSPSGSFLATTSVDDKIGVLSGTNYDEEFMINHDNQTCSYIPSMKALWGWDDSYIFAGNKKKGVDVISAYTKTLVTTLESPHMSAIPCRFDAHPFIPGMLAGAATGGVSVLKFLGNDLMLEVYMMA